MLFASRQVLIGKNCARSLEYRPSTVPFEKKKNGISIISWRRKDYRRPVHIQTIPAACSVLLVSLYFQLLSNHSVILIKGLGSFSILNLETYGPIVWMIVGLNVDLLGEKIFFMDFLLGRVNAKEALRRWQNYRLKNMHYFLRNQV